MRTIGGPSGRRQAAQQDVWTHPLQTSEPTTLWIPVGDHGCEPPTPGAVLFPSGPAGRVEPHGRHRDGEVLSPYDTANDPDGVAYVRCGNRRASVCPSCSHEYKGDV